MGKLVNILRLNPVEGDYGVEVEVEASKRLPREVLGWIGTADGSLRGHSMEYVMPRPQGKEQVKASLEFLQESLKDSDVKESARAGVHVHLNVQQWTLRRLFSFLVCYYMVEDLMVKWCGENREGNLFCLRSSDAEFVLYRLARTLEERKLAYLNDEIIRYASLNMCSMFRYGSLEFRCMRTPKDFKLIGEWVDIIDDLVKGSEGFPDPVEAVLGMSGNGEEYLIRTLFPIKYDTFLKMGEASKIVREAARRIQPVVFTFDWNSLEENVNKNPFKKGPKGGKWYD